MPLDCRCLLTALRLAIGLVLLAGLLALGTPRAQAAAPQPEPRFERIEDTSAIADGVVSVMDLDPSGMVWIGTSQGLVRFDGLVFTPIPITDAQGRKLGTTFIRTLLAARDGRIWVGTESEGLSVYDPRQDRWTRYSHDPQRPADSLSPGVVRSIAEDAEGRIWVGSIGGELQMLAPGSGNFRRFGPAQGLPDVRVQELRVDAKGRLWVGTWNGVALLAPGSAELTRLRLPDGRAWTLEGQVVMAISHLPDGSTWLGTQAGDLWRITPDGTVQRLDTSPSPLGAVQAIAWVSAEQVWVGRAAGIERRHPDSGALLQRLRPSLRSPWGLAGADIRSLVRDPAGLLWVGGYGSGLQRVNNLDNALWVRRADDDPASPLARPDVRSLSVLRNGQIWAGGGDGGIAVLDRTLRTVGHIPAGQRGLGLGRVAALAQAPDGRMWVGVENRVAVFNDARSPGRAYAVGPGRVRRLAVDRQGAVWAGTQDGLYRLGPGASAFVRVAHHDGRPLRGDVNALVQAADGTLWVGAEAGLFPVLPGAAAVGPIAFAPGAGLANNNVLGLLIDRAGRLWIDTALGLHRLNAWDGRTAHIEDFGSPIATHTRTPRQTFGANLLEDGRGRIWTQRGVFDPATGRVDLLSGADGVDLGTAWFRSYAQAADGRMLFGGTRGILVVQPEAFKPTRFEPPVVPTALRLGGLAAPLSRLTPELVLRPHEASFVIDFAALDLSEPARNRYRYRLQGYDDDWIEPPRYQRHAAYGALPPGRYVLEVQGSNRNGDWSPKVYRQDLKVLPHWWQTWWTRVGAVLGLGAAVWLSALWRTRLLRQRQTALEARVAEATAALEVKSQALEESALTDPLTGLRNRRFIVQRMDDDLRLLRRQFEEAQRRGTPPPVDADLCFVLIDIDHFKRVNDTHGHAAGDAVLVQMRERLQQVFRESDYLVRWGGEEFLVVARGTSREGLPELAERVRVAVAQAPFLLPSTHVGGDTSPTAAKPLALPITCSLGYACFPMDRSQPRTEHWSEALALADAALYAAKREGRNRWVGVQSAHGAPVSYLIASLNAGLQDPRMVVVRPHA